MVDIDGQDCESIIRDFSKGALVWYNFRQDSRILYIYSGQADEAVLELLGSKGKVDDCSVEQLLNNQIAGNAYDYIVGIDVIEESRYPQKLLNICHGLLKPEGRLVIGTENRYAINVDDDIVEQVPRADRSAQLIIVLMGWRITEGYQMQTGIL